MLIYLRRHSSFTEQEETSPWDLKARSWIFALSPLSKQANFPAGWAAPYQAEALAGGGEFIGGPGMIMVSYFMVHYTAQS